MSASMWAFNEEVCCGDWCRNDCDICPVRDEAIEATEKEEAEDG